jgi:hypothetical protein
VANITKRPLGSISQSEVDRWITPPRFRAFLDAADGERAEAISLYDWNVCISAVFFEALSYTEVLLRNAIDAQFPPVNHGEAAAGCWISDPAILSPKSLERVHDAIDGIKRIGKEPTRARVVSNLSFGFWRALLDKRYKQLWIDRLHHAFPNGSGDRKEPSQLMAGLNPFRNRLAHHESIINAKIESRHDDLLALTSIIDADAAGWLRSRSCVPEILAWRPPLTGRKRLLGRLGLTPRTVRFHAHR